MPHPHRLAGRLAALVTACLLTLGAARGTQLLVGVVLDSTASNPADRFADAAALLDWGFSQPASPLRLRPAFAPQLAAGTRPGS